MRLDWFNLRDRFTKKPKHEQHVWVGPIYSDDHAEIDIRDSVRHTSFHLLGCVCGVVRAVPDSNFALVTARYRDGLSVVLKDFGYTGEIVE